MLTPLSPVEGKRLGSSRAPGTCCKRLKSYRFSVSRLGALSRIARVLAAACQKAQALIQFRGEGGGGVQRNLFRGQCRCEVGGLTVAPRGLKSPSLACQRFSRVAQVRASAYPNTRTPCALGGRVSLVSAMQRISRFRDFGRKAQVGATACPNARTSCTLGAGGCGERNAMQRILTWGRLTTCVTFERCWRRASGARRGSKDVTAFMHALCGTDPT